MSNENDKHWNNPDNWGGGLTGWYFCKQDPRLWVPKSIPALGYTINLGHPKGGLTLVSLFLLPSVLLLIVLLISVVAAMASCGA